MTITNQANNTEFDKIERMYNLSLIRLSDAIFELKEIRQNIKDNLSELLESLREHNPGLSNALVEYMKNLLEFDEFGDIKYELEVSSFSDIEVVSRMLIRVYAKRQKIEARFVWALINTEEVNLEFKELMDKFVQIFYRVSKAEREVYEALVRLEITYRKHQ